MKYIKTYEALFPNFHTNDHVILKKEYFKDKKERFAKIEHIDIEKAHNGIIFYKMKTNDINSNGIFATEDMILRNMTHEEIEIFNIESDSNKYNL